MVKQPTVHERHFHYDEENVLVRCPDNVSLQGYFQTEKYFQKHIKAEKSVMSLLSRDEILKSL